MEFSPPTPPCSTKTTESKGFQMAIGECLPYSHLLTDPILSTKTKPLMALSAMPKSRPLASWPSTDRLAPKPKITSPDTTSGGGNSHTQTLGMAHTPIRFPNTADGSSNRTLTPDTFSSHGTLAISARRTPSASPSISPWPFPSMEV